MPSAELIQNFQEKNHVQLDREDIRRTIDRILTVNTDNKVRESKIGEYIMSMYPQIADGYERNRVQASVQNTGNATKTTALELFEEYVNIISQIVKEESDSLVEQSKEDAQKAKEAVDAAKADYEKKVAERDRIINNYKLQHDGSDKGLEEIQDYKEKYKEPAEMAKIALEIAKEKSGNIVLVNPYEASMDYFGISGAETLKMLNDQLNRYTYMDMRRSQIESDGVTSPKYMLELYETSDKKLKYQSASADDKKRLQEVYATKQIMQEKLDSHTGISGWLWRLVNRTETKAMRDYIAMANGLLVNASFDKAAEAEALDAMSERGYFAGEYVASTLDAVHEKFANNESVYAMEKQKEDARKAEQAEREKQLMDDKAEKDKQKAEYRNEIKNQLFEIKFRPANTAEQLTEQMKAYNEARAFIKDNKNIPEAVNLVFKANGKKIQSLSNNLNRNGTKAFGEIDRICEKYELDLAGNISVDDYKPMSFDEIKAAANAREHIENIDLGDKVEDKKLSEPIVNEPVKDKDPLMKN